MIRFPFMKYVMPLLFLLAMRCGPEIPLSPDNEGESDGPMLSAALVNYRASLGQLHLQVRVEYKPTSETIDVYSDVFRPDTDSLWFSTRLYDEGENGDPIAGDGYYSITLDSALSDTLSGDLKAIFWAVAGNDTSNILSALTSLRANEPPFILSVWAPDTIMRPDPGKEDTLVVEAEVTDPDGLKDIVAVFFEVRDHEDTTRWNSNPLFVLNDAGIGADRISGDGIFATFLIISSENQLTDNIFRYYALDYAGNTSPYVIDTITVYRNYIPQILNFFLSSPSQIVRPSAGSEGDSLLFYIHVEDENGLEDITLVSLQRRNPGGNTTVQSHPRAYDDGLHEDFSSGDGWYTIKAGFSSEDEPGIYFYRALVEDGYGNRVLSADSVEVTLVSE
ncbi:TPA: hypothetical protein DCG86_06435 [Candidatus Marinimicrobia bacterium]|nr:hypothetical protein [Candidatus Neomarinimicrobiota bacterium]HBY18942.1 hypothetical protein [Candidatus Neomarinimicrobiota bacterium]